MYRTVLAEGRHDDLIALLNRDLLIAQWPVLRTLISRAIRDVREETFPEPASARPAAAASTSATFTAGSSPTLRLPRMSSALVRGMHPDWRSSASSLESVLSRSLEPARHDDRPCCCDWPTWA
nr:hypothetical protein [Streptomyces sp. S465]